MKPCVRPMLLSDLDAVLDIQRACYGEGFLEGADVITRRIGRASYQNRCIPQAVLDVYRSHGVELVDSSVSIAGQAGDSIARMREMAQRVASLVGEVDGALREQSSASTEVAKKIEDIATQAEEANSIANETAHASDSMAQTAQGMQALVSRFKV